MTQYNQVKVTLNKSTHSTDLMELVNKNNVQCDYDIYFECNKNVIGANLQLVLHNSLFLTKIIGQSDLSNNIIIKDNDYLFAKLISFMHEEKILVEKKQLHRLMLTSNLYGYKHLESVCFEALKNIIDRDNYLFYLDYANSNDLQQLFNYCRIYNKKDTLHQIKLNREQRIRDSDLAEKLYQEQQRKKQLENISNDIIKSIKEIIESNQLEECAEKGKNQYECFEHFYSDDINNLYTNCITNLNKYRNIDIAVNIKFCFGVYVGKQHHNIDKNPIKNIMDNILLFNEYYEFDNIDKSIVYPNTLNYCIKKFVTCYNFAPQYNETGYHKRISIVLQW